MNLKLLSSVLGHANVSVTADTYLHVSDKQIIQGYRNFGPTIVGAHGRSEREEATLFSVDPAVDSNRRVEEPSPPK